MFKKISTAIALILVSQNIIAADPQFLKLKVVKMAVSTSPLCTGLVTVIDNSNSTTLDYTNFLDNPNLGSGKLDDGTYPCIAIQFYDKIKFSSDTTTGSCTSGTEVSMGVCQAANTSKMIDGTTTTCTTGEDLVTMYLSTASTSTTGSDAFNPPTSLSDAARGLKLTTALTVSGGAVAKFIVNGTGKIDGSGGSCDMQPPVFSFSQTQ